MQVIDSLKEKHQIRSNNNQFGANGFFLCWTIGEKTCLKHIFYTNKCEKEVWNNFYNYLSLEFHSITSEFYVEVYPVTAERVLTYMDTCLTSITRVNELT